MGRTTLRGAFVGRTDLLERIGTDSRRAHLIVGEPGIGKTRVLTELGETFRADTGGVRVAQAIYDVSLADRFEPLREVVVALDRHLQLGTALLERVTLADDQHLIRYIRGAIAEASARATLCIAIDDLFRAPAPTLTALAYLVDRLQDLPIHWHFASRGERAVDLAFDQLARANILATHELRPLSYAETARLVETVDPSLGEAQARAIFARSGGNPLFVELLAGGDSAWHTATLRAAVAERLRDLTGDVERISLFIATGRAVTRERVAVAAGSSSSIVDASCEELAIRGLLTIAPGGEMRFHHDLIPEAIVQRASESARSQAYEAWLRFATDGPERIRCLEGAARWNEVLDEIVRQGWRSAERAQLDAETLATRAFGIAAADDPRRYEVFAFRARARLEMGRFDDARSDFAEFVAGREHVAASTFATCYGRFAIAAAPEFGRAGLALLADLSTRAEREWPSAFPDLAHAHAMTLYCEADVASALAVVRHAKRLPASPVERIRQDIWEAYLSMQLEPAESTRAASILSANAAIAESLAATEETARACFMCAFIAHRDDDLVAAEAWCRRGLATPDPKPRSVDVALRTQLCEYLLLRGEAWEALGILLEASDQTRYLRRDARATVGAILAFAQALTGSLAVAERTLRSFDPAGVAASIFHSVETIRGWIFEIGAQTEAASAAYEYVIANATVAETSLGYAYVGRARIALVERDTATLERLSATAKVAQADGPKSLNVSALIEHFLALLAGDADALPGIVALIGQGRSAHDAAFTRLVAGEITGDRECLRAAAAAFDAIGTRSLADRARAAARRHGLRLAAARSHSQALSERSRSVAIGIAAGQTNAEIAADLHLSSRTVEKYVSSLLAHFNVRSRVEIAGIILRGELAPARK
jgi:DNA-binding CsgD family transcriptional regulator